MKKLTNLCRLLLGFSILLIIIGFWVISSSPNNIFIGIAFFSIAIFFMLFSIIPISKANALNEKQKEDRIKKLEEDIAVLKNMLNK